MVKLKEKKASSKPSKKWELVGKRKNCPKCGKGVYLGEHKNPARLVCGKCAYVEFGDKK